MRRGVLHMAVAFVLMGGWAMVANHAYPMPRPLVAGVVQGTLSALITLFLKRLIEGLAARLPGTSGVVLPPVAAAGISVGLLLPIHALAGTPDIARTVAVPLGVTFVYATAYTIVLRRRRHA